jgi:release factor glutamine methyltransferase
VHLPHARLVATDISSTALKIARLNAEQHGLTGRIRFIEADLFPEDLLPSTFDIICANLPYIPSETLHTLEIFGKEPDLALDGGPDGLHLIRKLITRLAVSQPVECLILLEIEQRQGLEVGALARDAFPRASVRIQCDLSGFDRLVVIKI